MNCKLEKFSAYALASKPSSSFSSTSSVASATSSGTSRSGGSRLLFGEIDTSSERSAESYASVCNFVQCDSSIFLKFWLKDKCRETLLSFLPNRDLANLRLACHDFSVRAAPALFSDLSITFKTTTFTRPSKLAALDRLGFYVKTLRFNLPHVPDTFLPPLVEPDTGAELSFTYSPRTLELASRIPRYGDIGTTEILSRQYPALFHAATNVPAFIRAFSALINLQHLIVSCPGYQCTDRYRRSVVDYALISLRIAVEKNSLNALDTLTLAPIHPGGIIYLSPLIGFGASPRSASRWSRIRNLNIEAVSLPATNSKDEPDQFRLLQTYLCNFQARLERFQFRWIGQKGPLPVRQPANAAPPMGLHPAHAPSQGHSSFTRSWCKGARPLHFPQLRRLLIENVSTTASDISGFLTTHKPSLTELGFEAMDLTQGTWDDALAPMVKKPRRPRDRTMAEIPIMLSPTTGISAFPAPMERLETVQHGIASQKGLRKSSWLTSKGKTPAARKLRDGLLGCEEQLRKVLRGSAFPWG